MSAVSATSIEKALVQSKFHASPTTLDSIRSDLRGMLRFASESRWHRPGSAVLGTPYGAVCGDLRSKIEDTL